MEGEISARAVKDRTAIRALAKIMKERNVSMEIKGDLRNTIQLLTMT